MWSVLSIMFYAIHKVYVYSMDPFGFRWLKRYIYIYMCVWACCISLSSSSNRKYQPSPLFCWHILPWLCLKWLYRHILSVALYLSRESWVLFPSLYLVKTTGLALRHITPSYHHHYAELLKSIQNIICFVRYMLSSVYGRWSWFSPLSSMQ